MMVLMSSMIFYAVDRRLGIALPRCLVYIERLYREGSVQTHGLIAIKRG